MQIRDMICEVSYGSAKTQNVLRQTRLRARLALDGVDSTKVSAAFDTCIIYYDKDIRISGSEIETSLRGYPSLKSP